MPPSLYIHVGAHKTGTSFLHKELCRLGPELASQGCYYEPSAVHHAKTLLARGSHADSLTADKVRQELELANSHGFARTLLISEHFCGNPNTGYIESDDIARSLSNVCKDWDVNILISVRRQDTFVESWYGQSIKEGGFWTFDEFLSAWPTPGPDWDRIVRGYENAFGQDKVKVVAYENAFTSSKDILDAHYLGWFYDKPIPIPNSSTINPSLGADALEIARQANRLLSANHKTELRRVLETCAPRGSQPFNLFSPEARDYWLQACAATNRRLSERHPVLAETLLAPITRPAGATPLTLYPENGLGEIAIQAIKLVDQYYRNRLESLKKTMPKINDLEARHAAEIDELKTHIHFSKHPLRFLASHLIARLPALSTKAKRADKKQIQQLEKTLLKERLRLKEANRLISRLRPAEGLELETRFDPSSLPADGSVVFATTIDDGFAPGLECLIYSLKTQHPDLRTPFHVFHDDGLRPATIAYLRTVYPAFEFHPVNPADYAGIEPHKRIGHASYRIFEAFRMPGQARVIALDADIVCLNPIGGLLNTPADAFAASLNVGENLIPYTLADSKNSIFNSGVMHIPAALRGEATFRELVQLARDGAGKDDPAIARFADQRVLNHYFRNRPVSILGLSYNANVKLGAIHLDFDLKRVGLLHFTGPKPWTLDPKKAELDEHVRPLHQLWHKLHHEARALHRPAYFKSTGALAKIEELRGIHSGKRVFILGNGPSLRHQDLSLLKNEIVFAGNWFALHERYADIDPRYYCLCSHTIFGGWDTPEPKLDENLQKLLLERTGNAIKFFSFDFRDYLEDANLFPGHDLRYLLYEKPLKRFIDSAKDFNLDPAVPLHDGHTVVVTFAMLLARWMGAKEIYLLGCDCDYGIKKESDEKQYFYDSALHTTKTSAFDHLQKVWSPEGGRIFATYEIVKDVLSKNGVAVYNATHGGCLEVFPRKPYESLFKA